MRATPARISRALKMAKRGLYERAWHVWTAEDEDLWLFRVKPYILQGETWDNARDIATYIYAMFFRTPIFRTRLERWGTPLLPSTSQRRHGNLGFLVLGFHLRQDRHTQQHGSRIANLPVVWHARISKRFSAGRTSKIFVLQTLSNCRSSNFELEVLKTSNLEL